MPLERFLIAPISSYIKNASSCIFNIFTKGCEMKTRKDAIDITGQTFSDLTAIKPIEKGKYRGLKWLCKCICGKETIAYGGHLRTGYRKSCGCRSQSRIWETGVNRLFSNYLAKAKLRKLEFKLTKTLFAQLIIKPCHYCGREPHQELKRLKSKKLQIKYNGIDRFDPEIGYLPENCVPCCYYCNHGKADLTIDEWKSHLNRIYKWHYKDFSLPL